MDKNKINEKIKLEHPVYNNSTEQNFPEDSTPEMNTRQLINDIIHLKNDKEALIFAHNYQRKEIQDIADFVGDSFELAKKIIEVQNKTIIFCGVRFMAETAKVLAPEKKIIIPDIHADCPLADSISMEQMRTYKEQYPDYTFICYINTNLEIKTLCDIVVTSANALKIISSLADKKIFFLPDMFLGQYIINQLKQKSSEDHNYNKEIILHKGFCPVHQLFSEDDVKKVKTLYPGAPILAHPESSYYMQETADYLAGTGKMIKLAGELPFNTFIIATEIDMVHKLHSIYPDKKFIPLTPKAVCPNMKKITLEKVYQSLKTDSYEITIPQNTIEHALLPIKKMIELSL